MRTGYNKEQPYNARDVSKVESVTIHYTASPANVPILNIAQYQIGPSAQEAFPAIAYHFIVDEVGDNHWLHDLDRYVWHSAGIDAGRPVNSISVGICYIGNSQPNEAQKKGIREAIKFCEQQLGRKLRITGHKDMYATACPGSAWPAWKEDVTP